MNIHEIQFTCYEVTQPDGVGSCIEHIAYFSSQSVALDYAEAEEKKTSWPKDVRERRISHKYIILDTIEELRDLETEKLKSSALAKLTPLEIKALGL